MSDTRGNLWDNGLAAPEHFEGRRYRWPGTTAQLRKMARTYIVKTANTGMGMVELQAEAFRYLSDSAQSRRICFSNAQLAAIAAGLNEGISQARGWE